jgi:hypothetical protein
MELNQQQADMLAQITTALQEAAPADGGQHIVIPGGAPPPGPPPQDWQDRHNPHTWVSCQGLFGKWGHRSLKTYHEISTATTSNLL